MDEHLQRLIKIARNTFTLDEEAKKIAEDFKCALLRPHNGVVYYVVDESGEMLSERQPVGEPLAAIRDGTAVYVIYEFKDAPPDAPRYIRQITDPQWVNPTDNVEVDLLIAVK